MFEINDKETGLPVTINVAWVVLVTHNDNPEEGLLLTKDGAAILTEESYLELRKLTKNAIHSHAQGRY